MPKYLIQGSYNADGAKALLKEGGSKRREAVEKAVQASGGTVEAFYFAYGETDLYVIVDFPDETSAIAASLVVNSSGTVGAKYTVLIEPEKIDEGAQRGESMMANYRAPGQ